MKLNLNLNLKEHLKGKKFFIIYERPIDIQRQEGYILFGEKLGIKDILVIPTANFGWGDYYGEVFQSNEMGKRIWDIFLDENKFNGHLDAYFKGEKEIMEVLKKVLEKRTAGGLLEIYRKRLEIMSSKFAESVFVPLSIDSHVVPKIKELLRKQLEKENVEKEWDIINQPTDLISMQKLQIKISELFLEDKLKDNLEKLRKDYGWMTIYRIGEESADEKYFESLVLGRNKEEVRKNLKELKEGVEKKKENLKSLLGKLDKEARRIVGSLNFYLTFRTERADALREIAYYSNFLFEKIFELVKKQSSQWEFNHVLNMIHEEVEGFLVENKLPDIQEIKKRINGKDYHYHIDGKFYLIEKSEDKELIKKAAGIKEKEETREFYGTIANKGKVKGKVKIVTENKDIPKVKKGDILVAIMTFPDFIPAMRKAAAFITDDGGITCHAAITARELKKPCIIGTKVATRVLKDGMKVEVDAEKGIVKILEKGK